MTSLTNAEYSSMMHDPDKLIEGDIEWKLDADHSPALEFAVRPDSKASYPIVVRGSLNRRAGKLSFMVIHQTAGRVFARDFGADHHNRCCTRVGDKHEHGWTEGVRDAQAMTLNTPHDFTTPDLAWEEFCGAAKINHRGTLKAPPPETKDLLR